MGGLGKWDWWAEKVPYAWSGGRAGRGGRVWGGRWQRRSKTWVGESANIWGREVGDKCAAREGGDVEPGTQKFVYQKWAKSIFPFVNFILPTSKKSGSRGESWSSAGLTHPWEGRTRKRCWLQHCRRMKTEEGRGCQREGRGEVWLTPPHSLSPVLVPPLVWGEVTTIDIRTEARTQMPFRDYHPTAPCTPRPPCKSNPKDPQFDGNNTDCCSDKGVVRVHREKTQAVKAKQGSIDVCVGCIEISCRDRPAGLTFW